MTFRSVPLLRDPQAAPITELIDYDEFCGAPTSREAVAADRDVTPRQLAALLRRDPAPLLVDVREPGEHELVHIDGDVLIPSGRILSGEALAELPRDREILLYCRSGARSAACLDVLVDAGFPDVRHLAGGVLAWADEIAPELPRY